MTNHRVSTQTSAERAIRELTDALVEGGCLTRDEAPQTEARALRDLRTNGRAVLGSGTVTALPAFADRSASRRIRSMAPAQFERWAYGL